MKRNLKQSSIESLKVAWYGIQETVELLQIKRGMITPLENNIKEIKKLTQEIYDLYDLQDEIFNELEKRENA